MFVSEDSSIRIVPFPFASVITKLGAYSVAIALRGVEASLKSSPVCVSGDVLLRNDAVPVTLFDH